MSAKSNTSKILFQLSVYYKDSIPEEITQYCIRDPKTVLHKDGLKKHGPTLLKRCTMVIRSIDPTIDRKRSEVLMEMLDRLIKTNQIVSYVKP